MPCLKWVRAVMLFKVNDLKMKKSRLTLLMISNGIAGISRILK
jgi:hypothetical protein